MSRFIGLAVILLLLATHVLQATAGDFLIRKKTASGTAADNRNAATASIASVQVAGEPLSAAASAAYLQTVDNLGTASLQSVEATARQAGGGTATTLGIANVVVIQKSNETQEQLQQRLGNDVVVLETKDEMMVPPTPPIDPNAATASVQSSTVKNWGIAKMRVIEARNTHGVRGSGVKVGVIDTGVDAAHSLISSNVERNLSRDFRTGTNALVDAHGHGTHVSGIIASTNDEIGAAPAATIVALRVTDDAGFANVQDMLRALEYAITDARVQVVNISMGSADPRPEIQDAWEDLFAAAHDAGICVCVATGNGGRTNPSNVLSPGSVFDTDPKRYGIAVGATTATDVRADFSTGNGNRPDVVAPGDFIDSLRPGGSTTQMSGTSQATPHVSGVLALAYSLPAASRKSPTEYRQLLKNTAVGISGNSALVGGGRVDAAAFLSAINNGPPIPPVPNPCPRMATGVTPEEHKKNIETLTTIRDFWTKLNSPPAAGATPPSAPEVKPPVATTPETSQTEEQLKLIREILLPIALESADQRVSHAYQDLEKAREALAKIGQPSEMEEAPILKQIEDAETILVDATVTDAEKVKAARESLSAAKLAMQKLRDYKIASKRVTELETRHKDAEEALKSLQKSSK